MQISSVMKDKDLDMACRDSCKEWYHRKCENTPDIVFDEESDIHLGLY